MRSSYIENNYGEVFQAIMRGFNPRVCVELGVLDGYSAAAIASTLKEMGQGHLDAYDLFEDYQYKHGNHRVVQELLDSKGLRDFVTLIQADAYTVCDCYHPGTVDLLHVDISNTGDTLNKIMEQWDPKMVQGGIILFEGGTVERDQVEWMIKYNAKPIKPELDSNQIIKDKYIYATYLKFPGLTMMLKKR